jgi:adenylate kinase
MLRKAVADRTRIGLEVAPILASGGLVPDDVMWVVVSDRLDQADCREGFILDGFPRTVPQAEQLDAKLSVSGAALGHVVSFDVPEAELTRRLLGRGRADDTPAVVRERLQNYARLTAPLKDWYSARGLLRSIDGTGTPAEVQARLRAAIGSSPR